MNSIISDDPTRENLALEIARSLKEIINNSRKVTSLHKELLEINLSISAYIEESKKRLSGLRLDLAHEAKSSQKVVEILSDKLPPTSHKRNQFRAGINAKENNNNKNDKFNEQHQARTFVSWYKRMIDDERQNFGLYISDDAYMEWFGRTIKTRKKVIAFLKFDMQCSKHDFTSVKSIDRIPTRNESTQRKGDTVLASPLDSPEIVSIKRERYGKKRHLRSNCNEPEWAEGCQPQEDEEIESKRQKIDTFENFNGVKRAFSEDESETGKGDGLQHKVKRKCVPVTPPNCEVGQGDCLPSTSGTDSDRSHEALNAQLPKLAVECNGYIEFTRTRNSRNIDSMKWERKCKVQISYSEDPLNIGEFIIWALRYTDESKCRRNLLAEFEEAARVDMRDL